MRAVCQRVSEARVRVAGAVVAEIGSGLLVLLGVARSDSAEEAERLARKVGRLRVFEDDLGKLDCSLVDVGGAALAVSQFTVIADTTKQGATGNRPSFMNAAPKGQAEPLYERFCDALAAEGVAVQRGVFGARMTVEIVNEGPVTIILDV
jgi:D-aminoacyl-tRNA deacylase